MNTANESYRYLLETVMLSTAITSPRGQETREYIGFQSKVDMKYPIVTIPQRKLNYQFMAAEAYWILTGQQGLDQLTPYCKEMAKFSDDDITLSGAYGPRFLSQVRYVVNALYHDWNTRQAVITLWERCPNPSKDIPCTVSMQWLVRDEKLHCNVFMRSSDCWLGWPYDVFSFTMMSAYVWASLGKGPCERLDMVGGGLGTLRIFAGSQHIYERDAEKTKAIIGKSNGNNLCIDTLRLNTPDALLNALGCARNIPNDRVLGYFEDKLCAPQ